MTPDNSYSEELFGILNRIVQKKRCSMIEAVLDVARELDVDVEDFVNGLGEPLKNALREEAIQQGMVRKCALPTTARLTDF